MNLSICMPYWQRQLELSRSLAAYRRVYPHADLEFSICDDGTPTGVQAPGCKVTKLPIKQKGLNPCVPMNAAVRASTRPIIVLTNPEIEHDEDVFTDMLERLVDENTYVTATCYDVGGMLLAGDGVDYRANGRLPVPPGAHFHFCAMLHRSLFDRVGGFDEIYRNGRSCEDADWLWTLAKYGARFATSPKVVWHYRTPHAYDGTVESNARILTERWSHLW